MDSATNVQAISERLTDFYGERGIFVCGFRCKHSDSCAEAAENSELKLERGAEAHVGSNYGQRRRVVVVALDTGGTSDCLDKRRERVEEQEPGNQHMRGTLRLLEAIYDEASNGSGKHHVFTLFAMTNAAKCSGGIFGTGQVGWNLFNNCREYVMPEIDCLDPELIVTQGVRAYAAIRDSEELTLSKAHQAVVERHAAELGKEVQKWIVALAKEYLRTVDIGGSEVPVMKTVHPSARGGQWQYFTRVALEPVAWLARCLMEARLAGHPGHG